MTGQQPANASAKKVCCPQAAARPVMSRISQARTIASSSSPSTPGRRQHGADLAGESDVPRPAGVVEAARAHVVAGAEQRAPGRVPQRESVVAEQVLRTGSPATRVGLEDEVGIGEVRQPGTRHAQGVAEFLPPVDPTGGRHHQPPYPDRRGANIRRPGTRAASGSQAARPAKTTRHSHHLRAGPRATDRTPRPQRRPAATVRRSAPWRTRQPSFSRTTRIASRTPLNRPSDHARASRLPQVWAYVCIPPRRGHGISSDSGASASIARSREGHFCAAARQLAACARKGVKTLY